MNGRWIAIACIGAAGLAGCVERELTITSQPEGALVYVSDREIGRTPVTIPFTWYGDYDILLRRDGYETHTTHAAINAPWYEVAPLDLFSHLAPWTYRDHRYLHYELSQQEVPADEKLIEAADAMRQRNLESPEP